MPSLRLRAPGGPAIISGCAVVRAGSSMVTVRGVGTFQRYLWLICIVGTCVNAAIFRIRARSRIEADPGLAAGYDTLARGVVTWWNIPGS